MGPDGREGESHVRTRGNGMHRKLDSLAEKGYLILRDRPGKPIARAEWESLEYMDWKSGGDTNFAPLTSATGEMDCRGFWDHGKPDSDGIWTKNRKIAPGLARYVEEIGGNFARAPVINLNPNAKPPPIPHLHPHPTNPLNPHTT